MGKLRNRLLFLWIFLGASILFLLSVHLFHHNTLIQLFACLLLGVSLALVLLTIRYNIQEKKAEAKRRREKEREDFLRYS